MLMKQIKTIGFIVAILGLVACGSNKGENVSIDGSYFKESDKSSVTNLKTGVAEEGENTFSDALTLIEIENNVQTTYTFSNNKKAVMIDKQQLNVSGKKLVSSKVIEELCWDNEGSEEELNAEIEKTNSNLTLTTKGDCVDVDDNKCFFVDTLTYKNLTDEDHVQLLANAKSGKIKRACVGSWGDVISQEQIEQDKKRNKEIEIQAEKHVKEAVDHIEAEEKRRAALTPAQRAEEDAAIKAADEAASAAATAGSSEE